ncbi:hypothetical protein C1H76_4046 [Elsinoe australis]|uniref:Uncharacterized protein n=1 Tax=Elsinoe australis TaxID=40998 RepID=A0A4U7B5X1_9PEZI|nr:hypothetical protein C1H76_4046 [Elsinoe australis]
MENGKSKGEVKAKTLEVLPTPNKSIGNAATVAAARDHGAEIRTALWELKEGTIAVLEMVEAEDREECGGEVQEECGGEVQEEVAERANSKASDEREEVMA